MAKHRVHLIDDGTLDTVISVNGHAIRLCETEWARDNTGAITDTGWKELFNIAIDAYEEIIN